MRKAASMVLSAVLLAACGQAEEKAAAPPAPAVDSPEQVARKLYGTEKPPADVAGVQAIFTPEFTAAMAPETGVPMVTYDYRYDAVKAEASDVTYASEQRGPAAVRVTVSFKQKGEPDKMVYDFCKRPDGQWRIRNIIDPDEGGGSLRMAFGLGVVRAGQCPMPGA